MEVQRTSQKFLSTQKSNNLIFGFVDFYNEIYLFNHKLKISKSGPKKSDPTKSDTKKSKKGITQLESSPKMRLTIKLGSENVVSREVQTNSESKTNKTETATKKHSDKKLTSVKNDQNRAKKKKSKGKLEKLKARAKKQYKMFT